APAPDQPQADDLPAPAAPESASRPAWMADFESSAQEEPQDTLPLIDLDDDLPDWLSQLDDIDLEAEPEPEEDTGLDWLTTLAAEPDEPSSAEPVLAPEDDEGWLDEIKKSTDELEAEKEIPDWVSNLKLDEDDEPVGLPGLEPPAEPAPPDLDWLTELEEEADKPVSGAPTEEVDTGDLLGITLEEAVEDETPAEEDEPEPEIEETYSAADAFVEEEGFAAQLAGLRFDSIMDQQRPTDEEERVGALKDLSGAIQAELIFDGSSLEVGEMVEQVVITPGQAERIARLEAFLEGQQEQTRRQPRSEQQGLLARLIISLLLLVAVAAPAWFGVRILPAPPQSPGVLSAQDIVADLPEDAVVFMAFEYEADTAAELEPLSVALLNDVKGREDVTVYGLSTRITGPALASRAFARATVEGPDPINLGYVPGDAIGIRSLTFGTAPGITSPLAVDTAGQQTQADADTLIELTPDLLIVVSAQADEIRKWVEQAAVPIDTPVIVATSVAATPTARAYAASGQVAAVMSGINDAVGYSNSSEVVTAQWNAQALGTLAAALAIIGGGALYTARRRRP
ncbi:MAG: hypothetical protein GYB64_06560, partial [Chloroflexi bacterium]|nr:hypothetical protein [Chloroflexota bacterium]